MEIEQKKRVFYNTVVEGFFVLGSLDGNFIPVGQKRHTSDKIFIVKTQLLLYSRTVIRIYNFEKDSETGKYNLYMLEEIPVFATIHKVRKFRLP
jgi:hypothetical protein